MHSIKRAVAILLHEGYADRPGILHRPDGVVTTVTGSPKTYNIQKSDISPDGYIYLEVAGTFYKVELDGEIVIQSYQSGHGTWPIYVGRNKNEATLVVTSDHGSYHVMSNLYRYRNDFDAQDFTP